MDVNSTTKPNLPPKKILEMTETQYVKLQPLVDQSSSSFLDALASLEEPFLIQNPHSSHKTPIVGVVCLFMFFQTTSFGKGS